MDFTYTYIHIYTVSPPKVTLTWHAVTFDLQLLYIIVTAFQVSVFFCDTVYMSGEVNKKLSYRRVTARCVLSVVILPIITQQCRNYLYDKS